MLTLLKKFKFTIAILLLALAAGSIWAGVFLVRKRELLIKFYDVGQGDSIFIRTPGNYKILIDGGPNTKVVGYLDRDLGFDRSIDLVVLTHPQADHLTGLVEVIRHFKVKQVLTSKVANDDAAIYQLWVDTLKRTKTPVSFTSAGDKAVLSDQVDLKIFWPKEKEPKVSNLNQAAVVLKITYKDFDLLLTADADRPTQPYTTFNQKIEVLKVPHHGSKTAIKEDYLKQLAPQVSVIMVGKTNSYGHPAPELIRQLQSINTKIFRTDQNGTVEIVSDGKKWYTRTQR